MLEEAAGYEARIGHDQRAAAELLVASAELRAHRLGDLDGRLRCLEQALTLDPTSASALDGLRSALGERGETDRLLDDVTRAAREATEPEASARLWLAVAVSFWITINEPEIVAICAYYKGTRPPEKRGMISFYRSRSRMIHAHRAAYRSIKNRLHRIRVSVQQST